MIADAAADWLETQEELRRAVGQLTAMLRTKPDPERPALGDWSVAEVAMHLSQAWVVVPGLARGDLSEAREMVPSLPNAADGALLRDVWELAELTTRGVGSDVERDLGVIADRIDERAAAFFDACRGASPDEPCPWLVEGVTVPRSALTSHLLNETLVHGFDIAQASAAPWPIERRAAAMVLKGFLILVMNALSPSALVDQARAQGVRVTYDVRLRGGGRFFFVFADGELRIEGPSSRPVDCRISADPVALLLVIWARQTQWSAIARGQLLAWGRKPWLAPRLRSMVRNP